MLSGFQQYLVNKGFKRTYNEYGGKSVKEDYISTVLSSYGPLYYTFTKDDKQCFWGLCEKKRPPVMFLGESKMLIVQNEKTFRFKEEGYRILFNQWKNDRFDEIYDVFMSDNKYFKINCVDENNISIEILLS